MSLEYSIWRNHTDLSRSTFQSSNPIGPNITCAYALFASQHPKLTPNPTLISPNLTNQIRALKRTAVL